MESILIRLPGEIRNLIYTYLVPCDSVICYKCSRNHHRLHQPAHRRCGYGPAWLCAHERQPSQLGILTANRQISRELKGLLYNRLFTVEIWDQIFVANTCKWEAIHCFPFGSARWLALEIHVPQTHRALQLRLQHLESLHEVLSQQHREISRLSFRYDDDPDEPPPDPTTMLLPILQALEITEHLETLLAGQKLRNIVCKTFKISQVDYTAYR
jgi:hypothetical protein